mgnify:CR=1 FL=1
MLHIIFEDNDILVVNKPSGIVVHPYDYSTEETLLDMLMEYQPDCFLFSNTKALQDGRTINVGGMVHKLDRDTSGVMIVAKNKETADSLREQFINHTVSKVYVAIVEGIINNDSFSIDAPLGRGKKEYKQSTNPINPRGELRDAVTNVEVLERRGNTTLVSLMPKTGRTHQLRAHMSSIGHPIVGDKAYGSITESERIMLHAKQLTCNIQGEEMTFTAEIPDLFLL